MDQGARAGEVPKDVTTTCLKRPHLAPMPTMIMEDAKGNRREVRGERLLSDMEAQGWRVVGEAPAKERKSRATKPTHYFTGW